ncbi:MAG: hypothetical protein N2111_04675 [Candidatus Sumerlaeaceae bacterium]|nr:hypothetical protein [Candidatus Sumerlaeaceae bacterium]
MTRPHERPSRIPIVLASVIAVLFALGSYFCVWPPDVVTGAVHTVGRAQTAAGDRFEVVHYWNYFDFYDTVLVHTSPAGVVTSHTLDGDDSKTWHAPVTVNEADREVTVRLSGRRKVSVQY